MHTPSNEDTNRASIGDEGEYFSKTMWTLHILCLPLGFIQFPNTVLEDSH